MRGVTESEIGSSVAIGATAILKNRYYAVTLAGVVQSGWYLVADSKPFAAVNNKTNSEPEVEFQYGALLFSNIGSSNASAVDSDKKAT